MSQAHASIAAKPRRGWFTFSLRTLFVAMTLLACWLGWELSVIRERKAVREQLTTKGSFQFTTSAAFAERYPKGFPAPKVPTLPVVRTWLGDEAIAEIWTPYYHDAASDAHRRLAAETFPEAEIKEWLPEPCHPGCFPRGTLVETPQGLRPIQSIAVGDLLSTVTENGDVISIAVQSVFITRNRLWLVTTDSGELLTTETQPLCSANRQKPVAAGQLEPGDRVLCWQDDKTRSVTVMRVESTERMEQVYNLVLSNSEIFVAGGFLARSKPPAETESDILAGQSRQVLPAE